MVPALVIERTAQMIRVLTESGEVFRGIPRGKVLRRTKVFAGDRVKGAPIGGGNFAIEEVLERKNLLIRPPIANADRAICVVTIKDPDFDPFLLDCLLVVYDRVGADPAVLFNKIDLLGQEEISLLEGWERVYSEAGYDTLRVSTKTGDGLDSFRDLLKGKILFLAGESGTGKSSILKALTGEPLRTGEVSRKLGRGRHTTTGVRLIPFGEGSFIADTPGFSRVDPLEFVKRKDVRLYFREFLRYECKYPDCTHTEEPSCGVREALERGKIERSRYSSYLKIIRYSPRREDGSAFPLPQP